MCAREAIESDNCDKAVVSHYADDFKEHQYNTCSSLDPAIPEDLPSDEYEPTDPDDNVNEDDNYFKCSICQINWLNHTIHSDQYIPNEAHTARVSSVFRSRLHLYRPV